MDRHELAIKTYDAIQKRKKEKALRRKVAIGNLGWNRYIKHQTTLQRTYYSRRHSF
jgi:hypothetical protein